MVKKTTELRILDALRANGARNEAELAMLIGVPEQDLSRPVQEMLTSGTLHRQDDTRLMYDHGGYAHG